MILVHIVGWIVSQPKPLEWIDKNGEERRAVWFCLSASCKDGNRLFDVYMVSPASRAQAKHIYKGRKIYVISHNGFRIAYNPRIREWRPSIHADYIELFINDKKEEHDPEYEGILDRWQKSEKGARTSMFSQPKVSTPKDEVMNMFKAWKDNNEK